MHAERKLRKSQSSMALKKCPQSQGFMNHVRELKKETHVYYSIYSLINNVDEIEFVTNKVKQ